jgi:integrase
MPKRKPRKDGRYQGYVYMGRDKNGKEKREYVFAYSEKELEKKLLNLKIQMAKGEFIENDKMTVQQWGEQWIEAYKSGKELKTWQMYDIVLRNHIFKELGHLKLTDVKPFHIQGLINSRHKQGLTKTLINIKQTLNQMFEQAIENDLMIKNPAKKIELPSKENKEKRFLNVYELQLIESADLTNKERAFIYLCLYAGLRRGEALALTRSDFKDGVIKIRKTVVFNKNKGEIKPQPKSSAGIRDIQLATNIKNFIENYVKCVKGLYLFQPETSAGIMTETSFRSMWACILRKINRAAGGNSKIRAVNSFTPHELRHTFATMLYYSKVGIKEAQYLMGHASADITLNIYTHLDRANNSNMEIEKLSAYLCDTVLTPNNAQNLLSNS